MRQEVVSKKRSTDAPPSVARLRMRIAETRIRQHRVAARLDISDGHLSHILAGDKQVADDYLATIAAAIEAVAAETTAA